MPKRSAAKPSRPASAPASTKAGTPAKRPRATTAPQRPPAGRAAAAAARTAPAASTPPHLPSAAAIAEALSRWFTTARRPLPWRTGYHTRDISPANPAPSAASTPSAPCRDPWVALMAEAMLQQTQVSRVIEYLDRFTARFPTPAAMAAAPESEVTAMWSGLGYYRRARNLRACAIAIVEHHGGSVPHTVSDLLTLPGIGRYTAGAISSIVFGQPEPIVDGNVARVLLRIGGMPLDPQARTTTDLLWHQAADLATAARSPGLTNEALMELGAICCTPRSPSCIICPLRPHCRAAADGTQDQIPAAKKTSARPQIRCTVLVITNPASELLLEQRPASGLWANMWQSPTHESPAAAPGSTPPADPAAVLAALNLNPQAHLKHIRPAGTFTHQTTHRELLFSVSTLALPRTIPAPTAPSTTRWLAATDLPTLGISNAAKKAITLATSRPRTS